MALEDCQVDRCSVKADLGRGRKVCLLLCGCRRRSIGVGLLVVVFHLSVQVFDRLGGAAFASTPTTSSTTSSSTTSGAGCSRCSAFAIGSGGSGYLGWVDDDLDFERLL